MSDIEAAGRDLNMSNRPELSAASVGMETAKAAVAEFGEMAAPGASRLYHQLDVTDRSPAPPAGAAPQEPDMAEPIAPPLIIDLDGTLTPSNLLIECMLSFIKRNPLGIFQMLYWLLLGRATLKRELACRVRLDAAVLPLNPEVEAYAVAAKKNGRAVYLATAADDSLARSIADRCGFFDGVLASDGRLNLKGPRKQEALSRLFPSGFAYVGDSRADFPVWLRASEVIVVGRQRWANRTAQRFGKPGRIFSTPSEMLALLESARPHQWSKNILVFVPALLGGGFSSAENVLAISVCFVALCVLASTTYLINDLLDIDNDRRHWSKCKRPIPSGRLPLAKALAVVPFGLAFGLLLPLLVVPAASIVLCAYLALTLAYSFALKRMPVIDVTVLAGLYTIRLVLGITAAGVEGSPWLLVFSMFQFASLCFAKRFVEAKKAASFDETSVQHRGYQSADSLLLFVLGIGTGIASVFVMVLYIMFDAFQKTFYGHTDWLWAFPIILFLWISRVWLMAARDQLDDDPVAFAVKDRPSLLLGCVMLLAFLLAWAGVAA